MSVYAGIIDYKHDTSGQRVNVTSCTKNANYTPAALNSSDIAVCKVSPDLDLGGKVNAVKMDLTSTTSDGVTCVCMKNIVNLKLI